MCFAVNYSDPKKSPYYFQFLAEFALGLFSSISVYVLQVKSPMGISSDLQWTHILSQACRDNRAIASFIEINSRLLVPGVNMMRLWAISLLVTLNFAADFYEKAMSRPSLVIIVSRELRYLAIFSVRQAYFGRGESGTVSDTSVVT